MLRADGVLSGFFDLDFILLLIGILIGIYFLFTKGHAWLIEQFLLFMFYGTVFNFLKQKLLHQR